MACADFISCQSDAGCARWARLWLLIFVGLVLLTLFEFSIDVGNLSLRMHLGNGQQTHHPSTDALQKAVVLPPPPCYSCLGGRLPIYFVTVSNSPRRPALLERISNSSLSLRLFDGVYAPNLTWTGGFAINKQGRFKAQFDSGRLQVTYDAARCARTRRGNREGALLSYDELGSALSHYFLYRLIFDENLPMAMIVDDDATFTKSDAEIHEILRHVPDPSTFDVAYLQTMQPPWTYVRDLDILGTDGYFFETAAPDRAYAYIVTQRFVRMFLPSYTLYAPNGLMLDQWSRDEKQRPKVISTTHLFVSRP